jgi:hypothetical protein
MTQSASSIALPMCCTGNQQPCPCCSKWMDYVQERERERQQHQHQHQQQQQHSSPSWPVAQCQFTDLPDLEQALDVDCCPLEAIDHPSNRVSRRGSADAHAHSHPMPDTGGVTSSGHSHSHSHGHSHVAEHEMATSSASFTQSAWPAIGSSYIDGGACPSTPALSLCASSSAACVPTLSLSQQFLAGTNGSPIDFSKLNASSNGLDQPAGSPSEAASTVQQPDFSSFGGLGLFSEQDPAIHFHHHHHAHLHPTALAQAAHVHCTEEQNLDQQQRASHVHSKDCNPQVHWQFAADNVLHDHTLPLLAQPASSSAAASNGTVKGEPVQPTSAKAEPSAAAATDAASSPTILPCSRVHTFPPAFRFHPYGAGAAAGSQVNHVARVSAVAADAAAQSQAGAAPASNCHQCKVKKYSATVIQCTAVHEVTVRRSKPMCCVQKKKCAKKYCTTSVFGAQANM